MRQATGMTLRARLLLIVGIATLVPALLFVLRFVIERDFHIEESRRDLLVIAGSIARDIEGRVRGATQLHYGLALTGARVKADEALRLGLINELIEAGELDAKAEALALRLAAAPQRAVRHSKRLISGSAGTPLADQLDAETAAIVDCVGDEDFREGVTAFLEKRKPRFPSAG